MDEKELAQAWNPAEQAPQPKEGNENQDIYKSFFEEAISKDQARQAEIQEQLSQKLSDSQKLALEKEAFEIERKLFSLGIKAPTQESVIEWLVDLGLKPGDWQYDFLKSAVQWLSVEEARPVIAAFKEFIQAGRTPGKPVNLTDSPSGNWDKSQVVWFSAKDIIWENSKAAKQNLIDLMSALSNKE